MGWGIALYWYRHTGSWDELFSLAISLMSTYKFLQYFMISLLFYDIKNFLVRYCMVPNSVLKFETTADSVSWKQWIVSVFERVTSNIPRISKSSINIICTQYIIMEIPYSVHPKLSQFQCVTLLSSSPWRNSIKNNQLLQHLCQKRVPNACL